MLVSLLLLNPKSSTMFALDRLTSANRDAAKIKARPRCLVLVVRRLAVELTSTSKYINGEGSFSWSVTRLAVSLIHSKKGYC